MNNDIICHLDMSKTQQDIYETVDQVWGDYTVYHIFNVQTTDYIDMYEKLAEHLGTIRTCHPVNNKSTIFSKSRDIKPDPNLYHYFASTTRQPLHTDYAYYETSESPDWLMLYCMQPSDFGGQTHLLSIKKLVYILDKYNPELLEKIKVDINWKYNGVDGDKIHTKPLYDGQFINWNYWQIKEELNNKAAMDIRQEFFDFLENVVVAGNIYDFSKSWNTGDCIIFSDRRILHGRDAFLGDRWLKDHAFFGQELDKNEL